MDPPPPGASRGPFEALDSLLADAGFSDAGPHDRRAQLVLTFAEAMRGCEREFVVRRTVVCRACEGSGAAPGATRRPCAACDRSGTRTTRVGFVTVRRPCKDCGGIGEVPSAACGVCSAGRAEQEDHLLVTLPPGCRDGSWRRVPGRGDESARAAPGDLLLTIRVATPAGVTADGDDLRANLTLDADAAARGGRHALPGLPEGLTVDVPAGARDGDELIVRGQGVATLDADSPEGGYREPRPRGDLRVTVRVARRGVPWRVVATVGVALAALAAVAARW